jgi:hypothetical protein
MAPAAEPSVTADAPPRTAMQAINEARCFFTGSPLLWAMRICRPPTKDLILRRREAPSRRMAARSGRASILRDASLRDAPQDEVTN